jgi:hypothetical protein
MSELISLREQVAQAELAVGAPDARRHAGADAGIVDVPGLGAIVDALAGEGGHMRALHRHVGRVFDSSRKGTHWGRRKLARDR